jgi:hypothetical protein
MLSSEPTPSPFVTSSVYGRRARRPGTGKHESTSREVSCPSGDISYEHRSLLRGGHRPQPFSDSRRLVCPQASLPCFMQAPPMGFKESRRQPPELYPITEFKRSTCDKKPRGTKLPLPRLHDQEPVHHPSPTRNLTTPTPRGRSSNQSSSRNCRQGQGLEAQLQPKLLPRNGTEREPRGCTNSTAEAASPVRSHKPCGRNRTTRTVHQRCAEARCSCSCPRRTPKRTPQASHRHSTEAVQGVNTLAAQPDKPSESLTIRPCEQGRREADTECRHNRKRN